ncbi:MAG: hypothetical protein K2G44_02285 [Clostridia bacterium]|nr:hypothetical protein [Clostridia bacterium]
MDKLAYHFNKKMKPAKTEGKYLYYYPCDSADNPDIWYGDRAYVVLEVSESEWETLFELDRLEYNNLHKYQRHTKHISGRDEDELSPNEQQRWIDKSEPLSDLVNERIDKKILYNNIPLQDRKVLSAIEKRDTQTEAASSLGFTQGYMSTALKRANRSIDNYIVETGTHTEIVWHCWNRFLEKGEMPYFLDVELEFVLRGLHFEMLPLFHWYYSVGELCRSILQFYLFENEKMDDKITEYLEAANEEDRVHFQEYYGDQPPIIGAVYLRLTKEMHRRQETHLHESDKFYTSIYATAEKIAKRLNVSVEEFINQRFYPYIAKWRNKRLRQFYKAYTGKKLPE